MCVRRLRLRLRVCGRRSLARMDSELDLSLPEAALVEQQAEWLAPARSQLLRRVHVARRNCVLDLGTGYGVVVPELRRRSRGRVVALDLALEALRSWRHPRGVSKLAGDATHLPVADGTFDLLFSQITLLWVSPLALAVSEIWRVLQPGGALVALEPDYDGMIEHPPEIRSRSLWINGLTRAGADPWVGRKLPGLLAARGFEVHISLFDTLFPPAPSRFDYLEDLPLTPEERSRLAEIKAAAGARSGPWSQVAHLPFFLIRAYKPTT